jgi:glycine cleavage system aminomethyltransferase T
LQAADGEFAAARGDGEVSVAELDEVAARGEAGEGGFELFASSASGAELADKLLEVGAGMRQLGHVL